MSVCFQRLYAILMDVQTFSLTIGGVAQHLISYYKVEDVEQGRLRSPSTLPELASLDISPEYLDKTHFRNPPKVEIGVDGIPRYRGEADDIETSPHVLTSPLAITPGYDEGSSTGKRGKGGTRYDPYNQAATPGRSRKSKKSTSSSRSANAGDTDTEPASPTYPSPVQQPSPAYPESGSLSATTNHYAAPYPYYPSYGTAYSPPYSGVPVSPIQPPPQSPTPPTPQQPSMAYPTYPADSHPQQQPTPYSYYPGAQGYQGYNAWQPYAAGYGQVQHATSHGSSSASSGQDRAPRDAQEDGEDGT